MSSLQSLPSRLRVEENLTVLAASPEAEDHISLERILEAPQWRVERCRTVSETLGCLRKDRPSVVLCRWKLPDGDWKDVLRELERSEAAPSLVVTSPLADEGLWAEVLNLGGYDVLLEPFDRAEVIRVLGMACRTRATESGLARLAGSSA